MNPAALLLPALRAREGRFDHEMDTIRQTLALGVGGYILFGGTRDTVRDLTRRCLDLAGRPLLFGADLERGAGQQIHGLTPLPPPRALATLDDLDLVVRAGAMTAEEAASVGINWVFAPVADLDVLAENPIVQTRSFGAAGAAVGEQVAAWIRGCQGQGVPACVKHYPGHGRTRHDSHSGLPVVEANRAELAEDLLPFRAAVAAGVASVMTAHVAFPSLDPTGLPATRSAPILQLLRDDIGFAGPVVTDALMMAGATAGLSEDAAAIEVVRAGVDVLLYPRDVALVANTLTRMMDDPADAARMATAQNRRATLFEQVASPGTQSPTPLDVTAVVRCLLGQGWQRGSAPALRMPIECLVIDDDVDGDWPVSSSPDLVAEALRPRQGPSDGSGSRVLLVFCEARAGKGRGGIAPARLEAIAAAGPVDAIVLFGHQRLVATLPGTSPVLVAWHRQPLMQTGVALTLMELSR